MSLYIFDMGEVLLLGVNTLRDIASAYGLDYKEFRVDYALYDKPLMEGYLHPRSYLEHLETKFDLSFDSDPFQVYFTPKLNERVMGFVRTLRERGDRVVVGSNTFSPHWEIVFSRYKEIPLSFDALYASHEMHRVKPDKVFFSYILGKEGFRAEDSYFIDDRSDNINSSSSLGIHSYEYHGDDENLAKFLRI